MRQEIRSAYVLTLLGGISGGKKKKSKGQDRFFLCVHGGGLYGAEIPEKSIRKAGLIRKWAFLRKCTSCTG